MKKILNLKDEYGEFGYFLESEDWKKELPSVTIQQSKVITEDPKISVIIANFNNEPYLKRMMDSLVNQSIGLENIQVMFVDDRSTDNSVEVILPYIENYPNIELYILDKNTGGAHGPRNVGLLHARGEYLAILDADDWYDPNGLKVLSDLLDKSGDGIAFGGVVRSQNGQVELTTPAYVEQDSLNRDVQDLPYEFFNWLGPQGNMVRHSIVKENNLHFVDQRVADDVTFFYQIMRLSGTISQDKRLTTYINRDDDNASLSKAVNETFLNSWMRALSYLKATYPLDKNMEKFMSRRLEWLTLDFALRWDTGFGMSVKTVKKMKSLIDQYLGELEFDPSQYFDAEPQKIAWNYLMKEDFNNLVSFVEWNSLNPLDKRIERIENLYYYVPDNSALPKVQIPVRIKGHTVNIIEGELVIEFKLYTKEEFNRVEIRNNNQPFERFELPTIQLDDTTYRVTLSKNDYLKLSEGINKYYVILNDYDEHMISIGDAQQYSAKGNVFTDYKGVMAVDVPINGKRIVGYQLDEYKPGDIITENSDYNDEGLLLVNGQDYKIYTSATIALPRVLKDLTDEELKSKNILTPGFYRALSTIEVKSNLEDKTKQTFSFIKKDTVFAVYAVELQEDGKEILKVENGYIDGNFSSLEKLENEKIVVNKALYLYSTPEFSKETRLNGKPKNSVLEADSAVISENGLLRFKLIDGNFITANPTFVGFAANQGLPKNTNKKTVLQKIIRKLR